MAVHAPHILRLYAVFDSATIRYVYMETLYLQHWPVAYLAIIQHDPLLLLRPQTLPLAPLLAWTMSQTSKAPRGWPHEWSGVQRKAHCRYHT